MEAGSGTAEFSVTSNVKLVMANWSLPPLREGRKKIVSLTVMYEVCENVWSPVPTNDGLNPMKDDDSGNWTSMSVTLPFT